MTTRRQALVVLGAGGLAARPSFAQQKSKVWRIGYFHVGTRQSALDSGRYSSFLQGMKELGYVEGRHFVMEERFASDGDYERLPALAMELVRANLDVIVSSGSGTLHALKKATTAVPVVFTVANDPVGEGLAASLARPGGNFTGLSAFLDDVFPKQVELLKIAVPSLSRIAVLSKRGHPAHPRLQKLVEAVAQKHGIQVVPVEVDTQKDFEPGFATMARERAGAVIILGESFFVQHFRDIAALALKHRLASTYSGPDYPKIGGLMSYGPNFADNFHRAASYVVRILKGAKPADMPIEQPTRLYLVINRKTAQAIGLTIPQELLFRADTVIE